MVKVLAKIDDDNSYWQAILFFAGLVCFAAVYIWETNIIFFKATKISAGTFISAFTFFFVCLVISWFVVHVSARNKRIAKETEQRILSGEIMEDRRKIDEDSKALELKKREQEIYLEIQTTTETRKIEEMKAAFQKTFEEKTKGFPLAARAFADYLIYKDALVAEMLRTKSHPAIVASDKIKEIAKTKKEFATKMRVAEYQVAYYEELFPWLTEFKDIDDEDLIQIQEQGTEEQEEDSARRWLTAGEYTSLTTAEKYQLALERYQKNRKTKWQIGRDYERYVGYLYEQKGYRVRFHGIVEGYEDLGRDLICTLDTETCIVQCKYWASHKTIHEKHINQLFGTAIMYAVQQAEKGTKSSVTNAPQIIKSFDEQNIKAVLITSTEVSETAKQFANVLGVEVQEKFKMTQYPMIKCNVNPSTGERIYHLPFDQQYDRVQCINSSECYVATIKEAEQLGFRRAMRWHGTV